jgi:hypothetical protein
LEHLMALFLLIFFEEIPPPEPTGLGIILLVPFQGLLLPCPRLEHLALFLFLLVFWMGLCLMIQNIQQQGWI